MLWHGEVLLTAEMKWMMNFTTNAGSQPFHVAMFTFDDVLKDATWLKMKMWIFFKCQPFGSSEALLSEWLIVLQIVQIVDESVWLKGLMSDVMI